MTYLEFLIIFLITPMVVQVFFVFRKEDESRKPFLWGILALVVLAVTYTTPWDNYLVKTKVWTYGLDRVLGTIGYVPIEEYGFFVLQTVFSGLHCYLVQKYFPLKKVAGRSLAKTIGTCSLIGLFFLGVFCLQSDSTRYMGLIVSWAVPVLLLQWAVGGEYILGNLKPFFLSVMIPTVYLWVADGLAISWGIWSISEVYTMGYGWWSLPIEEATFFLVTNLMVVQGLILFVLMRESVFKTVGLNLKKLKNKKPSQVGSSS